MKVSSQVDRLSLAMPPGQCAGVVRSLRGPIFLSRQHVSLLSSSRHPTADGLGYRITGSAGGDHRGCRVFPAPTALSVGRLAVVFGNAGPGHRSGGDLRSFQGRPLYVSESDWIVDRAGLGRVEYLLPTTISPRGSLAAMDTRRGVGSGGARAGRRRLASDFVLARYRDGLDARPHAPSKTRWLTIVSPASTLSREKRTRQSAKSTKRWRPIRSLDT